MSNHYIDQQIKELEADIAQKERRLEKNKSSYSEFTTSAIRLEIGIKREQIAALKDKLEEAQSRGMESNAVVLPEYQLKKIAQNIENGIPKNNGLPWSVEDDRILSALFSAGASLDSMARCMERKVTSIIARLEKFGLINSEASVVLAPIPSQSTTTQLAIDKHAKIESDKLRNTQIGDEVVAAAPTLQSKEVKIVEPLEDLEHNPLFDQIMMAVVEPPRRIEKDHADKIAEWSNENFGTNLSKENVKQIEVGSTVAGALASIFSIFFS